MPDFSMNSFDDDSVAKGAKDAKDAEDDKDACQICDCQTQTTYIVGLAIVFLFIIIFISKPMFK